MTRSFLDKSDKREVPYACGRYFATTEGIIYNSLDGKVINVDNEGFVEITIIGIKRKVPLLWVLAATFKPMYEATSFILDWSVVRYSGKKEMHFLESLIWVPPKGGQPCLDNPDYRIIPGHTLYSISNKGKVWNRAKKCEIKSRPDKCRTKNPYYNFTVREDGTGFYGGTLSVHRGMALAWLEYGSNVFDLVVNHNDGDKGNNTFPNVEWSTYSENNTHAIENKFRDVMKPTIIEDMLDNEILEFRSLTEASKHIGENSGRVYSYIESTQLRGDVNRLFLGRYKVYYKGDKPDYEGFCRERYNKVMEAKIAKRDSLFCCAKNVITGVTYIAESPYDLRAFTNLDRQEQYTALESTSKWPYKGWHCWKLGNPREVYEIDEWVNIALKGETVVTNPIIENRADGTVHVYKSIRHAALECKLPISTLRHRLMSGNMTATFNGSEFYIYQPKETYLLSEQ